MPTNNAITNQHQLDQLITCIQNGTWNEHSINIDAREISSLTKLFAAFRASRKMRYKLNTLEIFALKADNITISDFENLSTLDMQHGKIKKLSLSNLPYLQNINFDYSDFGEDFDARPFSKLEYLSLHANYQLRTVHVEDLQHLNA